MDLHKIIDKSKHLLKQTKENLKNLQKIKHEKKVFAIPEIEREQGEEIIESIVHISSTSAVKSTLSIIAILILGYFLYSISSLLILFFISLFFAATLDTGVDYLEKFKVPRWIGVIFLFIIIVAFVILIFGSMVPIVIEQISHLITTIKNGILNLINNFQAGVITIPYVGENVNNWILQTIQSINVENIAKEIFNNFSGVSTQLQDFAKGSLVAVGGAVGAGASVAGNVISFLMNLILVLFLTFFMVTDKENLNSFFRSLFPPKYSKYIESKSHDIQHQIGSWIRGQLILMVIMFAISYIGLNAIGMGKEYGLTLALIMGIGEFLPYIGPIIFLVVSLPIALNISFFMVFKLLILYSVLQFLEGNILVPAVMKKAVGLSPIVILLVILIGFQFLGVIGAIIAVPVSTAIGIFIKDYISFQAKKN